jgi:hypothetical protein
MIPSLKQEQKMSFGDGIQWTFAGPTEFPTSTQKDLDGRPGGFTTVTGNISCTS